MLKHQYKILFVSLAVGFAWIEIYRWLAGSWFFSRLSLLFAIISFVPAGLVFLIHAREAGPFLWWSGSNVVLTTRRSPDMERFEIRVLTILWAVIFVAVVVVVFTAR
jgi:hypothetical protein